MFPSAYALARLKEIQPLPLSVLAFRLVFQNFSRLKLVHKVMQEGLPGYRCLILLGGSARWRKR